ncbi:MAG TPA: response regulator [Ktedonobacteraceae bacterium]|jgi:DNA-binding response OmpR family regulator/predicted regulator of Ras-like GTPase activity (Roadblock/LC7/MglB family)|nr:response regulator [Ktedonobacteraceae bacterium]
MSDVWRIFVVESDESLSQNIVNSLRKDGYEAQGVLSGADAVRVLWSEEYDVVISDLKTPGAEGIDLLQWLRVHRPNTHIILIGEAAGESGDARMQALESGAASYLEKPLDIHLLKEELRRLLQQTGFSANLDSFDLLDVIQIITLSRKSIALLVNTGLEEQGILRFKNGELIWAEYGILRGEEAFFALAAHKNGTVIHQPWNDHITSNVTQPLSRLIFQALQYRTKYANKQQFTGEQEAITNSPFFTDEIDDRPFTFLGDAEETALPGEPQEWGTPVNEPQFNETSKEWWEKTGSIPEIKRSGPAVTHQLHEEDAILPGLARNSRNLNDAMLPAALQQAPVEQKVELPSWLTGQPTSSGMPMLTPDSISGSFPNIPVTPFSPSSSTEWPMPEEILRGDLPLNRETHDSSSTTANTRPIRRTSSVWPLAESEQGLPMQDSSQTFIPPTRPGGRVSEALTLHNGQISQPMQAINTPLNNNIQVSQPMQAINAQFNNNSQVSQPMQTINPQLMNNGQISQPMQTINAQLMNNGQVSQPMQAINAQRITRRGYNYASLIAALQTLGYAISGFESAAIASIDGQPIAQVSIDDQDLSQACRQHSVLLKNALQIQDYQQRDVFEDLIIQSQRKRVLLRMVGDERNVFLLLITTREADLNSSQEVVSNIENAISAALRG